MITLFHSRPRAPFPPVLIRACMYTGTNGEEIEQLAGDRVRLDVSPATVFDSRAGEWVPFDVYHWVGTDPDGGTWHFRSRAAMDPLFLDYGPDPVVSAADN